jgi:hypothetical protein
VDEADRSLVRRPGSHGRMDVIAAIRLQRPAIYEE